MSIEGTVDGVSHPVWFGLLFLSLAALGGVWWSLSRAGRPPAEIPSGLDDYDVALLGYGGGEDRAVAVAMLRLREAGVLHAEDAVVRERAAARGMSEMSLYWRVHHEADPLEFTPRLRQVQPLPPGSDPVEQAVYEAAADSPTAAAVRYRASRSAALAEKRRRLSDMGLLLHSRRNDARKWQ